MSSVPRRIVTGHDRGGKAVVLEDGPTPSIIRQPAVEGLVLYELWATSQTPAPMDFAEAEPTERPPTIPPAPSGTVFRFLDLPPDPFVGGKGPDAAQFFEGAGAVSAGGKKSPHPMMHRTETVDYAVCLEGEVTLVLDDSEVLVRKGDVVVQRGTNHSWLNHTSETCRMMFVLADAAFTPELKAAISAFDAS